MAMIKKPEWSFYPAWILLTALCIPIAFVLSLVIDQVIVIFIGDIIYVNGVLHITEDYLFSFLFVPISGILTGFLQYGLLRRFLPRMGWWIVANVAGWSLFALITGQTLDQFWFMVLGVVPGCATAVTLLVLMNQVQPAETKSA